MHLLFSRTWARALFPILFAMLLGASSLLHAATRHTTVTAPDGVVLAVQESGNPAGPAIVLIHGLLGSHMNWDAQRASPALQGYRLISYDLRGHGRSSQPRDAKAYSEGRRWADDLALVIAATGAHKPVLVGWSLGGVVISNYLAAHGDSRIGGAVYVDGVIELGHPEQIAPHPAIYRDLNAGDLATRLDAQRAFLALCFATRPNQATFERLLGAAAMASWDMQASVFALDVPLGGLAQSQVPIMLLYGARDALVNTSAAIARARQVNPRATQRVYAESGHAPFTEEPERFSRDLARFVDAAATRAAQD